MTAEIAKVGGKLLFISGKEKRAFEEAKVISHNVAIAHPKPNALPYTEETRGI
jgi:hypothetical protein